MYGPTDPTFLSVCSLFLPSLYQVHRCYTFVCEGRTVLWWCTKNSFTIFGCRTGREDCRTEDKVLQSPIPRTGHLSLRRTLSISGERSLLGETTVLVSFRRFRWSLPASGPSPRQVKYWFRSEKILVSSGPVRPVGVGSISPSRSPLSTLSLSRPGGGE